ncbi:MAG: phytoene/squalene synthase family protein [Chlorobiota bacterium]
MDPRTLAASYAVCRRITRRYARTFYFASQVLGPRLRSAAYAVYAFCRVADDLVDRAKAGAEPHWVQQELDELRRVVAALNTAEELPLVRFPWYPALRQTVHDFGIPPSLLAELLKGVRMDLEKSRYATFQELVQYCYGVASVVGLMMCHIFGYRDEAALGYAIDMGIAMQLTNILRDVAEDYRLGRVYLPQEELRAFGYTEQELAHGIINDAFRALMAFQIERARLYYRRAWEGIALLKSRQGRICTRIMGRLYAGILDEIEHAGYDVFRQRAAVRLLKKVVLGAQAALKMPAKVWEKSSWETPTAGAWD